MKKSIIYFRAEGNSKIGLGHVTRLLAIADMLKEDFKCNFIISDCSPALQKQILEVCERLIFLPNNIAEKEEELLVKEYLRKEDILVLDGYHFDLEYQKGIKKSGCKLVFIDDYQHTEYLADLVINHAPGLSQDIFKSTPTTSHLLGSQYAMLRAPFLEAAKKSRVIKKILSIFICFGGADFNQLTLNTLKLINDFSEKKYEVNLVLGGANEHKDNVRNFVKTKAKFPVNIFENLSANEMVKVMQKSDCAIVPSSSILYEVLAVKMPTISGHYVDNQINIYNGFKDSGVLKGVGDFNDFKSFEEALEFFTSEEIEKTMATQKKLGIAAAKNNFRTAFKALHN